MTRRTRILIVALAALAGLGLLCEEAQAQYTTYYYAPPIIYDGGSVVQTPVHYHLVPTGTDWHWTPALGWHGHERYAYVPCPPSVYYRLPASSGAVRIIDPPVWRW